MLPNMLTTALVCFIDSVAFVWAHCADFGSGLVVIFHMKPNCTRLEKANSIAAKMAIRRCLEKIYEEKTFMTVPNSS